MARMAWGAGLATLAADGTVLDTWYRWLGWGEFGDDDCPTDEIDAALGMRDTTDDTRPRHDPSGADLGRRGRAAGLAVGRLPPPAPAVPSSRRAPDPEPRRRLRRAEQRRVDRPGPGRRSDIDDVRLAVRLAGGTLTVHGVDKFPRMTDYVIPSGVRIADASRVRLGAHLASGTTVMHEGFCNFNAGTLGTSMVEGRISGGVIVGDGSDIGGGASILGTLSGGGKEQVTIGERCLLGANGGIGISLGDDCVVEAGLYVTASTPVLTPDGVVKARELSGQDNLMFIRDGQSGKVVVRARTGAWGTLNADLHAKQ